MSLVSGPEIGRRGVHQSLNGFLSCPLEAFFPAIFFQEVFSRLVFRGRADSYRVPGARPPWGAGKRATPPPIQELHHVQ